MHDYSGPLREDFSWQMLAPKTLARFGREIMLCNQIHDRSMLPLVGKYWGSEAMTELALDEWMGSSPIYNRRNRLLHGIQGDGVDVIMKGFQLDIGAPHMWLQFHYDVESHDRGYFWLTSCGAYNGVREMTGKDQAAETQICVHMEDPTFDATVMAVNRGARCTPVYRPPHADDIPAAGPCRWEVSIADRIGVVEENAVTAVVAQSRAAQFEFSRPAVCGDGMANYSGPFKRDFRLEDLDSGMLATQVKEFALDVHLLQRACYTGIARRHGMDAVLRLIPDHAAAMASVYQMRMRRLFGIEGDGMASILKLLQIDHHFVPEYVKTGVEWLDDTHGRFWIEDCAAIGDGEPSGLLTDLWQGSTLGLQQIVANANPRSFVQLEEPSDKGRLVFGIDIDPAREAVPQSPLQPIVGASGLAELDLSEHTYRYAN